MTIAEREGGVRHYDLPGAIDLFVYPTERFKTTILSLLFHRPLDGGAAAAALVPYMLRRGTRRHPDMVALERHLESLFGAGLDVDVFRFGERQALSFRVDVVDDRFLFMGDRGLFQKGALLLRDILLRPALRNGGFPADAFEQERVNLRRFVDGLRDDRGRYALDRCVRSMCAGEPYARSVYGEPAEIDELTREDVFAAWTAMLERSPIEAYVVGSVDPERARDTVEGLFSGLRSGDRIQELPEAVRRVPRRVRHVRESADVVQSRLVMGFRTEVRPAGPLSAAFAVWNTIFGAGSFCRLFREVRERRSLAYYCSSSADLAKGVVFVQAGIDGSAAAAVERVVRREMKELAEGRMSLEELRAAKASLESSLHTSMDSPSRIAGFLQERQAAGSIATIPDMIRRIRAVRRDAVSRAARAVKADTFYLLAGGGGT